MIQEEFLIKVIERLETLDIPYMVTGGMAVIFYGRPRLTHDFDIVVEINPGHVQKIVDAFKDDFYVDKEAIREALDDHSMFNIIDGGLGMKVDFWMLGEDEYDSRK